jgi:hypothetical protein
MLAFVYSAPISDLEVLSNASQDTGLKLGIFDRVRTSERRRTESCGELHGNNLEHLL